MQLAEAIEKSPQYRFEQSLGHRLVHSLIEGNRVRRRQTIPKDTRLITEQPELDSKSNA